MRIITDRPASAYKYFWAKIVHGANLNQHCARGLLGSYVKSLGPDSRSTVIYVDVPDGSFLYVCGVARGYNANRPHTYAKNFHLAVQPKIGSIARVVGCDGLEVTVEDAEALVIPELQDGYNGLDLRFTRCRNYQFAVAYFGR